MTADLNEPQPPPAPKVNPTKLLTAAQVSAEYGLPLEVIRQCRYAVGKRHLKSVKGGHCTVLFRRSSIELWIAANES